MSEVRPLKNTPSGGPNTRQQLEDAGLGMGKVPPQAVQLEEAVLGAMMLDKDCVNRVIDILRPESFYDERNQKVYEAIFNLAICLDHGIGCVQDTQAAFDLYRAAARQVCQPPAPHADPQRWRPASRQG